MSIQTLITNPKRAALASFLLALPLGFFYAVAVFRLEPLDSTFRALFTRDDTKQNLLGLITILSTMVLLLPALVISLLPMWQKRSDGKRSLHVVNLLLAGAILMLITLTWGGMIEDLIRCDILHIPQCD